MICVLDDYCVHQTPQYLAVPGTTDRNFYDRYFFNGYTRDASLMFGIAFGRYPNRLVKDGHFTVVVGNRQYSLHASDDAVGAETRSTVGPMCVEIIEPMRILRCTGSDKERGIAYDLTFEADTGVIDEGRITVPRQGIVYIDMTRFMQYGTWHGWIEIDGQRRDVLKEETVGLRDKSWGIRLFGENHATHRKGDQMFWMNVVMRFPERFSVIRTIDRVDGSWHEREGYFAPVYRNSAEVPIGEQNLSKVKHWSFDLGFEDRNRRVTSGTYHVLMPDGETREIQAEVLGTFWYAGMGYNHDKWNHGLDHGGLAVEREDWDTSEVDLSRLDRQFMCSVIEVSEGGRSVGFGHTEQLILGPYDPYGWGENDYVDIG